MGVRIYIYIYYPSLVKRLVCVCVCVCLSVGKILSLSFYPPPPPRMFVCISLPVPTWSVLTGGYIRVICISPHIIMEAKRSLVLSVSKNDLKVICFS